MTAEERLLDEGYEGVVIFSDFSYDDALIGVSEDNRAIYDFNRMVKWLMKTQEFTEEESIEWIDYNTIRSLPYCGHKSPIIMYPLLSEDSDEEKEQ